MSISSLTRPKLEGARGAARDAGGGAAAQVTEKRESGSGVLEDGAERTGIETDTAGGAAVFVENDNPELRIAGQGLFGAGRDTRRLRTETTEMGVVDTLRLILVHTDPGGRGAENVFVMKNARRLAGAATRAPPGVNSDRLGRHATPL
jgi:hypothetical protein